MIPKFQNEHRCKFCGKQFFSTPEYVFKIKDGERIRWFCKYTCMVRYREQIAEKRKNKKKGERK